MNKKRVGEVAPSFSPGVGVQCHRTPKEEVQVLLDQGFFDNVDALVLAVSKPDGFTGADAGRLWDRMALVTYLNAWVAKLLNG